MAKNYKSFYNQTSDSNALEQRVFIKEESVRGTFAPPAGSDFLFTLAGGGISATQALNSSAHRSGRHNNNFIKEKRVEEFALTTYFNVNSAAANGNAAIDTAVKTLWESMLGFTEVGGGNEFIANASTPPNITFSMIETGDSWAKQMIGGFIESCEISLPGDGQAQASWAGSGGSVKLVGLGQSVINNNATNDIDLAVGEGVRFPVGSFVMIIEADGVTRSADTPSGAARQVTAVVGDTVTIDGAVLADADGSGVGAEIYLAYYEPDTPAGIDNPFTGLVGEVVSSDLPAGYCFRSLNISLTNNHEKVDYCFGTDGLDAPFFIPAGRLDVSVSAELNLSKELVGFYNKVIANEGVDISATLGPVTGRRYIFTMPKVVFQIPSIEVPETGSIPVTYEGLAYQTVLDAADEIEIEVA